MKVYLKICIPVLVLVSTLACAFVQNMIFPPSPAPAYAPTDAADTITCSDDECIPKCMRRLNTILAATPLSPIGNPIYEEQKAEHDLVMYKVNGDEITDPSVPSVPSEYRKYQEDTDAHLRIWNLYVAVMPPELRKLVKEFVIFTDGHNGNAAAWVRPSSTTKGYWQIGFDLLDSDYPSVLADSLIHETTHLLTLNTSQIPHDDKHYYYYDAKDQQNFPQCEQLVVNADCSLPDSYINLFYQRFWKDSYPEWWETQKKAQNSKTSDEYHKVIGQFYEKHRDWFVDKYAATNIQEDMAESFSFFVLNPKPSGSSIYEQKAAFYYEFPELIKYRQQIIAGLCSYNRP